MKEAKDDDQEKKDKKSEKKGKGKIKTSESPIHAKYTSLKNINDSTMASGIFKEACNLAGIPETRRQASKWNNGKGSALKMKAKAHSSLKAA